MVSLYTWLTRLCGFVFSLILQYRLRQGKEDASRINERKGVASYTRPKGTVYWIHGASVGEVQSALILVDHLLKHNPDAHILMTSGTQTSAQYMAARLPNQCIHQFMPLDHPQWVARFIEHWCPDIAFLIESELWPNMLMRLKHRDVPAVLLNARLSDGSYIFWKRFAKSARKVLSPFHLILTQNEMQTKRFQRLSAANVITTDNIKYSAAPLYFDKESLNALKTSTADRLIWAYASTHDGEESIACDVHVALKQEFPSVLTMIIPRHPKRAPEIVSAINKSCKITLRDDQKRLPGADTDIYIANTIGEMGAFFALSPIVMMGRSLSKDGGGGHNPIEPAHFDCAVLSGDKVKFQQDIFDAMIQRNAVTMVGNKDELYEAVKILFSDNKLLKQRQRRAQNFAQSKGEVINTCMTHIAPLLKEGVCP